MSNSICFKPTEEFVKSNIESKLFYKHDDMKRIIEKTKTNILVEVMSNPNINKEVSFTIMGNCLDVALRYLSSSVEQDVLKDAVDMFYENGTIEYSSWEYSSYSVMREFEDFFSDCFKDLLILKHVVTTPDYFNDKENFDTKREDIDEVLGTYIFNCRYFYIEKLSNLLNEFKVDGFEEDGVENEE